jgi:hypothetical protein
MRAMATVIFYSIRSMSCRLPFPSRCLASISVTIGWAPLSSFPLRRKRFSISAMRTLLLIGICVALVGCGNDYGTAIVNRSDRELNDVSISSQGRAEQHRTACSTLPVGGYMQLSAGGHVDEAATVRWRTKEGGTKEHVVTTSVPPGFSGYAGFEFTTEGSVRFRSLKRSEVDSFTHPTFHTEYRWYCESGHVDPKSGPWTRNEQSAKDGRDNHNKSEHPHDDPGPATVKSRVVPEVD